MAMMDHSQQWVNEQVALEEDCAPEDLTDEGNCELTKKFNAVKSFPEFKVTGKLNWRKCPECVLAALGGNTLEKLPGMVLMTTLHSSSSLSCSSTALLLNSSH